MSATRGLGRPQGPPLRLPGGPILIVTAMTEERDAIIRHAKDVRAEGEGFVEARIGSAEVAIAATGSGPQNAKRESSRLCEALHPAALLGFGVAAALSRELEIGDLLASSRVRDSSGDLSAPDEHLLSRAIVAGARAGMLLSVERPAVTAQEKAVLAALADSGGPSAADMESSAWAASASEAAIPYLVVRSISDRAEESLPDYIAASLGEDGGISRGSVVAHALLRPRTIPALLRMRRRVLACSENLALFLERLLEDRLE
jgi:adenosylhomocysteine nucleosidase